MCDEESDNSHDDSPDDEPDCKKEYSLYNIAYSDNVDQVNSYKTKLLINEVPVSMTIDTGAVVSVMPEDVFDKLFEGKSNKPNLSRSEVRLKTYTGQKIHVVGEFQAKVASRWENHVLPMVVTRSEVPNQPILLGRNWMSKLQLDWKNVTSGRQSDSVQLVSGKKSPVLSIINDLKKEFQNVFEPGIGTIKDIEVELVLKDEAVPVFCKARSVPYALRDALEKEIEKLISCLTIRNGQLLSLPGLYLHKNRGTLRLNVKP
ncbi:uncharacterized protein K02A2.6-like [Macrosteles quadrilineatus]|uniref:uncharacterized protein K02A2.6-like n=1 Tax=Macrosteles quadrilineatus TaxID=74068 RepID=UPI0023E26E60|nr:uncharacterized protein K02A2.6-like [Macrosteles quadrilineatus]